MSNNFKKTKFRLEKLLNNDEHKVVVLKGKWGTGKTKLWKDISEEKTISSKKPIYVSLFGVKTINELKLRLFKDICQSDIDIVDKAMLTGGGIIDKFLGKFTGYSTEEGILLWLPNLLKYKLIVIDDIERKHKSLDIDELLGFLDEYSQNHKNRFLILINTDKLSDSTIWSSLHEKIIDVEITLEPTSSESFDIAANKRSDAYISEIKKSIEVLKINNIRVINKIINTVVLLRDEANADDDILTNWIPSTVLLTASHYRAIENPPPFEYIKSSSSWRHLLPDKENKRTDNEIYWDALLWNLGIVSSDRFEEMVYDFLQNGMLDIEGIKSQFEIYKKQKNSSDVDARLRDFFQSVYWDPDKSQSELLELANNLLTVVSMLNYETVTAIVETVENIGETQLANKFIDACLDSIENQENIDFSGSTQFGNKVHKKITEKLEEIELKKTQQLSLIEALENIVSNGGWGNREIAAFSNSTVEQYEAALKQLTKEKLRIFFNKHIKWINSENDNCFSVGAKNFLSACRNIYSNDPTSRLSRIIYWRFDASNLTERLK